jgi:catechol 2,3-dioxygenase-like lactoylglutathione lyase family enzyme
MRVRSVRWIGTATPRYAEMTAFCRDVLGLEVGFSEPTTTEFLTTEGDAFQVMGPGHPYADLFGLHATGPVPLLEVDDLAEARSDLEEAGIEIVGPPGLDEHWEWFNLRAPDGNLYEVGSRRR